VVVKHEDILRILGDIEKNVKVVDGYIKIERFLGDISKDFLGYIRKSYK